MLDYATSAASLLACQGIAVNGEREVCVRVRLVFQREMPPFLCKWLESMGNHRIAQKHSVFILLLGDFSVVRMALFAEEVEGATHVDLFFSFHVEQGEVHRGPAAVAGVLVDVALREEHILVEFGIEVLLHARVIGVLGPLDKVRHRHLRSVGIVDYQAAAFGHEFIAGCLERCC